MQAASDLFLGWAEDGAPARYFYVRQLKNRRLGSISELVEGQALSSFANLCGRTLARAHARSGDAVMLAGYMEKSKAFDDAFASFAMAYAPHPRTITTSCSARNALPTRNLVAGTFSVIPDAEPKGLAFGLPDDRLREADPGAIVPGRGYWSPPEAFGFRLALRADTRARSSGRNDGLVTAPSSSLMPQIRVRRMRLSRNVVASLCQEPFDCTCAGSAPGMGR